MTRKLARFRLVAKCPKCPSTPDEELTALEVYRVRKLVSEGLDRNELLRKVRCQKPGCGTRYWIRAVDYVNAEVIARDAA